MELPGELVVVKHQIDGTKLLIYIYTRCHTFITVEFIFSVVVTMYAAKFLYEYSCIFY